MILTENIKGGLFIASGMLILAIVDNYVRFIAEDIGLWQFQFIRSLIAVPAMIFFATVNRYKIWPKNFKLVLFRTVILVFAMFIYFGSLAYFPIFQVAAGFFTAPIFVVIFSIFIFGEQLYLTRILAIFFGSIGVILVLGFTFYDLAFLGVVPIAAGAFYALSSITLKRWCAREAAMAIMLMFFLGMGVVGAFMISLIELNRWFAFYVLPESFITLPVKSPSPLTILIIFLHALGSILGGILITLGYQKGETSFVSIFEYSFLIFATLWAYMVFSERIPSLTFVGITFIIFSGVLLSFSQIKSYSK